jgi:hypothetical protein
MGKNHKRKSPEDQKILIPIVSSSNGDRREELGLEVRSKEYG